MDKHPKITVQKDAKWLFETLAKAYICFNYKIKNPAILPTKERQDKNLPMNETIILANRRNNERK